MSAASIVLLILGIIFFVVSFFLPEGKKKDEKPYIDEKIIKDLVNKEVESARETISDMVDETVNYSVEKTERQLEKISNEKIMAVDEYSETVLKKINDNHQEAVFLYDMLNEKGEKLKNSNDELIAKTEELKEKDHELEVREEVLRAKTEELTNEVETQSDEIEDSFKPFVLEKVEEVKKEKKPRTVKKPVTGKQPKIITPVADKPEVTITGDINNSDVELHFDKDNESRKNSNELIRKLHDEGKSNMAIAKELGLGVGEVKLVIDLFANKK